MPKGRNVMVLRFLGVANYEFTYRNQVILLDAGIELLPWWEQTGLTRDEMSKKVDGIMIGHAHGEHIWDAPYIAQRTGATVVADPIGAAFLREAGLPEKQIASVEGLGGANEIFKFDGFTVEAVLGHHNIVPGDYMAKSRAAAQAITLKPGLNEVEQRKLKELGDRGPELDEETRDKLVTEGTIRYFFSFDNGFRLIYGDSAGPPTDAERRLMQRVPSMDVALIPYYGLDMALPLTMDFVRLFKPSVMLPTHHDGHRSRMLDMPLGPIALQIRDEFPRTKAISPLLRTPVCIDTVSKEVYVGQ
jgi:L-ascorbate metabolism protein UlaG (beta-lactamase superfamily)